MIILLAGASHTGKTALAQKLMEKYKYPYLSLDHLKMGLIRSKKTKLTPSDDDKLTEYLWPITREIIKTVIENEQNLIIEGCYIPFNWKKSFENKYLDKIRCYFLIMTENYIENNFNKIKDYANVIEKRLDDSYLNKENVITDNEYNLKMCKKHNCCYILIDDGYDINIEL